MSNDFPEEYEGYEYSTAYNLYGKDEAPLQDLEGGTTVSEEYDGYISKCIQNTYKKKLIPPLAYLGFLLVLCIIYPVLGMLFPTKAAKDFSPYEMYENNKVYINATLNDLYFTGYTKKWLGKTQGYYYYTMQDDDCYIVLLDPETCKQGQPNIDSVKIKCRIKKMRTTEKTLLNKLAKDLSWTKEGMENTIWPLLLSETDATSTITKVFSFLFVISFLFATITIIVFIIYIFAPDLSPTGRRLRHFGNPKKLFADAENELATCPQLVTDDIFITANYFIDTSIYSVSIIPIKEIVWIYKYSTLHKILWHHFSISYTLYITGKKHQYIKCPKNAKSDIDGVMDYLAEANHNILVGFSEENRLKVKDLI